MLRRLRDLVTLILFLGLVAVSLIATGEAVRQGLPEPQIGNPVERLQWLAAHDIRPLPSEEKLRIVHRLEEDFVRNVDWQAEINGFDDAQWDRFAANFEELMRLWFLHKVETWSSLPPDQQNYYIDEQFPYLISWRPFERSAPNESTGGLRRGRLNNFGAVAQRIGRSLATETPQRQEQIKAFAQAVVDRAFLRFTSPGQFGRRMD